MKQFLLQTFTWWNGMTIGTRFFTWLRGTLVGEDEFGNRYYTTARGPLGERRWVIYAGEAEPTSIPPGWYGWMHRTVDLPPTEENYLVPEWVQPHRPNPTGTSSAYRPKGSALRPRPARPTEDYQAWTPGR